MLLCFIVGSGAAVIENGENSKLQQELDAKNKQIEDSNMLIEKMVSLFNGVPLTFLTPIFRPILLWYDDVCLSACFSISFSWSVSLLPVFVCIWFMSC